MSRSAIIAASLVLLVAGSAGVYAWYQNQGLLSTVTRLQANNITLRTDLGIAKTDIISKSIKLKGKDSELARLASDLDAKVKAYGVLQGELKTVREDVSILTRVVYRDKTVPSTGPSIPCPKGQEITSIPFSHEDFRITINGDAVAKTLSYQLHQKFKVKFLELELPDGKIETVLRFYELNDKGKEVGKLTVSDFSLQRESNTIETTSWWNNKLDLYVGYSITGREPSFGAGVSLGSRGVSKNDLRWRFPRLGIETNGTRAAIVLSPVQYNLGKNFPDLDNLWITPSFGPYVNGTGDKYLLSLGIAGTL